MLGRIIRHSLKFISVQQFYAFTIVQDKHGVLFRDYIKLRTGRGNLLLPQLFYPQFVYIIKT